MPAFLPFSLVLDIIERSLARDFFDEDWATYLARLAALCRVCKAVRDLVRPTLWITVRLKSTGQLAKLRPPQRTNRATRKLYGDVRQFIGAGPCCRRGGRQDEKAAQVVRYYFPNVEVIRLRGFGRGVLSMAAFASFDKLCDITLENYHLQEIQPNLVLPNLKTLSLVRMFVPVETLVNLFNPTCTPNLKHAFLSRFKFHDEGHDAETCMPLQHLDLGRLDAVQIDPSHLLLLPHDLRLPDGPCGTQTKILLSWQAPTTRFHPAGELPEYFQLNIPEHVCTDNSLETYFEAMVRNVVYAVEDFGFEAVFLPERLRSPTRVPSWLRPSARFFLQACFDCFVPVIFYRGGSDASTTMSAKFLDYIRSPTDDENPLTIEGTLGNSDSNDSSKWTNVVGLEVEEWEDEEEEIDQDEIEAEARDLVDQILNLSGPGPVFVYIDL